MAVRVRLTRVGSKKNPIWRVVVTDQRSPRDGRFIEQIGHYNPQAEPSAIVIDRDRLEHWIERGAQPSNTVRKLMRAKPPEPAAEAPAAEDPAAEAADEPVGDETTADPETAEPADAEPPAGGEAEEAERAEAG